MLAVSSRFDRLVAPTLGRHLLLALGAAVVLFLLSSQVGAYDDYNLTAVAIFAVAAAGLTLLTGLNGQLSLGHGALMAVGAYTASLLLKDHQLPVIVVLLLAVLTTGIVGIVFGYAAARLRGPYLAGATLTLAVALPQLATRYKSIFGGDAGLSVPPSAPPAWLGADFPPERWLAWIALAAALLTMVLLANLLHSSVGRSFIAVRDNEVAAALAGIDVARTQVLAFVIGALGSLAGAIWGSIVLVFVPALTSGMASSLNVPSSVANNLPLAIYGAILVIAMLAAPHGIQGALTRLLALARTRWGHSSASGKKGVMDWDDPAPNP